MIQENKQIIERNALPIDDDHMVVVNPEWRDARYSYAAVYPDGRVEEIPLSVRGNEIVNGELVAIPHTITVRQARERLKHEPAES